MCKIANIFLIILLAAPCIYTEGDIPAITDDLIKQCEDQGGYCDDVPEYPKDIINQLVVDGGLNIAAQFFTDELTNTTESFLRSGSGQCVKYCDFQEKLVMPQLMKTVSGKWVWIVNGEGHQQGFKMQICKNEGATCSEIISSTDTSKSTVCAQQYYIRDALVAGVYDGTNKIVKDQVPVKSSCTCLLYS